MELWRRGQAGWPRGYPLVQFPNPPLLFAFAGWSLAAAAAGGAHDAGRWAMTAGVAVWAWEETTAGANAFRRLLGVGGLAWVAVTLAGEL